MLNQTARGPLDGIPGYADTLCRDRGLSFIRCPGFAEEENTTNFCSTQKGKNAQHCSAGVRALFDWLPADNPPHSPGPRDAGLPSEGLQGVSVSLGGLGCLQQNLRLVSQGSLKDLHFATNLNMALFQRQNQGKPPFTRPCSGVDL